LVKLVRKGATPDRTRVGKEAEGNRVKKRGVGEKTTLGRIKAKAGV